MIQFQLYNALNKLIVEFVSRVFELIINEKIISISNLLNSKDCVNQILDLNINDFVNLTFHNSGKSISDIGNERECFVNKSFSYFQVRFYLKDFSKLSNREDEPVMDFLEQNFFYVGFCFVTNCKEVFENIVNKDNLFRNYISEELKINEMYIYFPDKETKDTFISYIPKIFGIFVVIKMII